MSVRVDMNDLNQALDLFHKTKLPPDLKQYCDFFIRYLEDAMHYSVVQDSFVISEAAHQRIQLLLTPHAETLLRIWAIRQKQRYKGKTPPELYASYVVS